MRFEFATRLQSLLSSGRSSRGLQKSNANCIPPHWRSCGLPVCTANRNTFATSRQARGSRTQHSDLSTGSRIENRTQRPLDRLVDRYLRPLDKLEDRKTILRPLDKLEDREHPSPVAGSRIENGSSLRLLAIPMRIGIGLCRAIPITDRVPRAASCRLSVNLSAKSSRRRRPRE